MFCIKIIGVAGFLVEITVVTLSEQTLSIENVVVVVSLALYLFHLLIDPRGSATKVEFQTHDTMGVHGQIDEIVINHEYGIRYLAFGAGSIGIEFLKRYIAVHKLGILHSNQILLRLLDLDFCFGPVTVRFNEFLPGSYRTVFLGIFIVELQGQRLGFLNQWRLGIVAHIIAASLRAGAARVKVNLRQPRTGTGISGMSIVDHSEQTPVLALGVVVKGVFDQLLLNNFLNDINREFNALGGKKLVGCLNALAPHIDVAHQRHGVPGIARFRDFAPSVFRTS